MELTIKQCNLLLDMFNASITRALQSGIPIGKEYYADIDAIKDKLYAERQAAVKRERENKLYDTNC